MTEDARFRLLDHTADIGIEAWGDSPETLFNNAAYGLVELIVDRSEVRVTERRVLSVSAANSEELLVRWLSEILYLYDQERFLVARATVDRITETDLVASVAGEPFDPDRHRAKREVKAVTYHGLSVSRGADAGWRATVIFDI